MVEVYGAARGRETYNPGVLVAIESSFDDAGIAIGTTDGAVLASRLASQIDRHQPYRGVIPELAARTHIADLPRLWRELADESAIAPTAIGVTAGPGLPGSLLAGVNFARGLAAWHGAPLYGLNHIEGHIFSPFMGIDAGLIPYPFLALVVSGGHTELFEVRSQSVLKLIGQTHDDAVGELLDKVSAMLGHGYPGGAELERRAVRSGVLDSAARYPAKPFLPVPLRGASGFDFSYSGLKTAVLRHIRTRAASGGRLDELAEGDLLACLFSVICDSIWDRVKLALDHTGALALSVSGGVAINGLLRTRLAAECGRIGLPLWLPQPRHCLDNAEMMLHLLALARIWRREQGSFDIASSWLPGEAPALSVA